MLVNKIRCILIRSSIFYRNMCSVQMAVVNYNDNDEKIWLSFRYGNGQLADRQFNFIRTKEENVGITLNRIEANIAKAIAKKTKVKRKKREENETAEDEFPKIPLGLKLNSELVDLTVQNIEAWKEGAVFNIGDVEYVVSVNAPTVTAITLPKCILAGFPVYPNVKLLFADEKLSQYEWFKLGPKKYFLAKGADSAELKDVVAPGVYALKVGEGALYQTTADDVGLRLMVTCIPRQGDRVGFAKECMSEEIEANPGSCPFEGRHRHTQNETKPGSIRCVSYNILADLYADSDFTRTVLFPYCPPSALKIGYRIQLILKEILGYRGDIICLQEVDTKVYKHDISLLMEVSGLSGCFNEKGGQVVEGLACLFHNSKFRLIDNHSHIVAELLEEPTFADIRQKVLENDKLQARLSARTTALQVVILQNLEMENSYIVVGNTHLYFHPDADHIRLLQAYICLHYLEDLVTKLKTKLGEGKDVGLLLFGDFNSCPEFGVYQLMTTGSVSADSADWSSNTEEAVPGGLNIKHNLKIASACGTPTYTNFTAGFNGCLDYIFYDTQAFEIEQVVPMPSHEDVTENTALPSIKFPSDHLALVCTLQWRKPQ